MPYREWQLRIQDILQAIALNSKYKRENQQFDDSPFYRLLNINALRNLRRQQKLVRH